MTTPLRNQPRPYANLNDVSETTFPYAAGGSLLAGAGSVGLVATGSIVGTLMIPSGVALMCTALLLDKNNPAIAPIVITAAAVSMVGCCVLIATGSPYATGALLTGGTIFFASFAFAVFANLKFCKRVNAADLNGKTYTPD